MPQHPRKYQSTSLCKIHLSQNISNTKRYLWKNVFTKLKQSYLNKIETTTRHYFLVILLSNFLWLLITSKWAPMNLAPNVSVNFKGFYEALVTAFKNIVIISYHVSCSACWSASCAFNILLNGILLLWKFIQTKLNFFYWPNGWRFTKVIILLN